MASARVAPQPYWIDNFSVAQSLAVNYTVGWGGAKTDAGSVSGGRLANFQSNEGSAYALRSVPSPDFELSIRVPLVSSIRRTWRLHARADATDPNVVGYVFHLRNDASNDGISLYRNGVKVMGSTQWAFGQDTWPNAVTGGMRLSVVGGTVRAKWWTGDEPSEWGFEYVDANPLTAGTMAGFGVANSTNRSTSFAPPFIIMPT